MEWRQTNGTTLKVLEKLKLFLTRNFKSILQLDQIRPSYNQPAFLYAIAKTYEFQNAAEITKANIKISLLSAPVEHSIMLPLNFLPRT